MEKIPIVPKPSNEEVWKLLPEIRKRQLEFFDLKEDYLKACETQPQIVSWNPNEYVNRYTREYKNFAEFTYLTFKWVMSPQKFKWWYNKLFNETFVYPEKDGPLLGYTTDDVLMQIDRYPSDEELEQRMSRNIGKS